MGHWIFAKTAAVTDIMFVHISHRATLQSYVIGCKS